MQDLKKESNSIQQQQSEQSNLSDIDNNQDDKQNSNDKQFIFDNLTQYQILGYGVGHFFNDLCAAAWFNYLVYFLKTVIKLSFVNYIMLVGQVADAVSTPLVGYLSDRTNTKFGKRTPWYFWGTLIVIATFLPTWHDISNANNQDSWYVVFYYITFPALLNVGWAAVQIAHMSLVPSISSSRKRRDKLNSLRNTFTFLANLVVLICALILFQYVKDSIQDFEYLSYIIAGIGIPTVFFFLYQIREVKLTTNCTDLTKKLLVQVEQLKKKKKEYLNSKLPQDQKQLLIEEQTNTKDQNLENDENSDELQQKNKDEKETNWKQWFKEIMFYQYGIAYMGVRLYCNIFSTLMNYYLIYVLQYAEDPNDVKNTPIQMAIIPLILYLTSVLSSMSLSFLYKIFGRKITFCIGGLLMVLSSIALALLNVEYRYLIYIVACFVGVAQALTLNTGLTMISEVIGIRGSSGAFVFGAYSFLDKISSGIALFIITSQPDSIFESASFIRWCIVLIPGCACSLSWIIIMLGNAKEYDVSKQNQIKKNNQNSGNLLKSSFQSHSSFIEEFAA